MSLEQTQQQQQQAATTTTTSRPLHICITGTSQGIGLATAQRLVAQGHVVYHACRTVERAQAAAAAAGGGVVLTTAACDLADLQAVQDFAKALEQVAPRLDVLCLNAGMAPSTSSASTSPPLLTKQGFEMCIGVNHIGHFLLMQLLYRKLLASSSATSSNHHGTTRLPRIVITSSSVHDPNTAAGRSGSGHGATLGNLQGLGVDLRPLQQQHSSDKTTSRLATMVDGSTTYDGTKVYKDAKLCNILTAQHAARIWPTTIMTLTFNPGLVTDTGLFRELRNDSWMKATALTWAAWAFGFSVPVDVAAQRLCYLITANDDTQAQFVSGTYFSAPAKSMGTTPATGFVPTPVSEEAANVALAQRLWDRSLEIVQEWL